MDVSCRGHLGFLGWKVVPKQQLRTFHSPISCPKFPMAWANFLPASKQCERHTPFTQVLTSLLGFSLFQRSPNCTLESVLVLIIQNLFDPKICLFFFFSWALSLVAELTAGRNPLECLIHTHCLRDCWVAGLPEVRWLRCCQTRAGGNGNSWLLLRLKW